MPKSIFITSETDIHTTAGLHRATGLHRVGGWEGKSHRRKQCATIQASIPKQLSTVRRDPDAPRVKAKQIVKCEGNHP